MKNYLEMQSFQPFWKSTESYEPLVSSDYYSEKDKKHHDSEFLYLVVDKHKDIFVAKYWQDDEDSKPRWIESNEKYNLNNIEYFIRLDDLKPKE